MRTYGGNFGWQAVLYPRGNMGLFNVPVKENETAHQYVVNLATGAWCRFTGLNANCWSLHDDDLFFGGAGGKVHHADIGTSDDGAEIVAEAKSSFHYFGAPGRTKRFTMVRPNLASDGNLVLGLGINTDFADRAPTSTPSFSGSGGSPWDTTDWDTGEWGDDAQIANDWLSVTGLGTSVALRLRIATSTLTVSWQSTDWVFEAGGIL